MAEYTRPATWDDRQKTSWIARKAEGGVEYALVGGYAIAAHGFNRFSEDIDILVNPVVDNSRRWIVALSALPDHATRELVSDPDVFATDARVTSLRINDEITIDVMPSIAGYSWREMCSHIETINLDGIPLPLLNLEGLLLTKQGQRPKDQMDAALLSKALQEIRNQKR